MTMLETIKARRSVRKYIPQALEEEKLAAILEAGTYAPSGGNNQTTHFLVIRNKEKLAALRKVAVAAFARMEVQEGMYKSLANTIRQSKEKGGGYDFTYGAPVLVLVANKRGYGNAMADCALALENMFLQATSMGIGSCYINQIHWLTEDSTVLEQLYAMGLQAEEQICGGAVFGYSAVGEQPPLKRTGNPITYID